MSNGLDFPLEFAKQYSFIYLTDLIQYCERGIVVGSVRRCSPVVHDLEFLIIPKTEPQKDMFGTQVGTLSLFEAAFPDLVRGWNARIIKDGPRFKKVMLPEGLALEICVSDASRFGVEMVIKTGPADFSHKVVAIRQHGGYLPSDCVIKNGWQVYRGDKLIPQPTEEAFLSFLGLGWIDPEERK